VKIQKYIYIFFLAYYAYYAYNSLPDKGVLLFAGCLRDVSRKQTAFFAITIHWIEWGLWLVDL